MTVSSGPLSSSCESMQMLSTCKALDRFQARILMFTRFQHIDIRTTCGTGAGHDAVTAGMVPCAPENMTTGAKREKV